MRFHTPDAALRWALHTSPLRANDPARVSVGRSAGRAAFDVANDARSRIIAVLQRLDQREQAALVYRAYGHSFREIGLEIECSPRTARRLVIRGREILADRLRAIGILDREEGVADW